MNSFAELKNQKNLLEVKIENLQIVELFKLAKRAQEVCNSIDVSQSDNMELIKDNLDDAACQLRDSLFRLVGENSMESIKKTVKAIETAQNMEIPLKD